MLMMHGKSGAQRGAARNRLTMLGLCLLLLCWPGATALAQDEAPADKPAPAKPVKFVAPKKPLLRPKVLMSPMTKLPTIDGVLTPGEWATFHMSRWVGGKDEYLAERPGEFWLGSDGKQLYIAVRTAIHPSKGAVITHAQPRVAGEDSPKLDDDDALEIWVTRTPFGGKGEFHLVINPAGAVWDAHHQFDLDLANHITRKAEHEESMKPREHVDMINKAVRTEWTAGLKQAHTVKDGFWVAELAIELASLEVTEITDCFAVRVCRNFQQPKEQCRWAPGVLYFTTPGTMPTVCFSEAAPIVSETGFQDAQGIRMGVEVSNPTAKALSLEVTLRCHLTREEEASVHEEVIELPPGETKLVELVRPLSAEQLAKDQAAGEIRVRLPRRGLFYHRDVRWRLRPAGPLWQE